MTQKLVIGLFALSLLCCSALSGYASEAPGAPPPAGSGSPVQRHLTSKPGDLFVVLKNGLTVLIHQQPQTDVVSTQVFVRAGSIYEGQYFGSGISHYLEHVVAGGSTRSFTEAEAKKRLELMGGASNAYTSFDRTVYYINTSAEHWKDALDLLLSYVSENTLDPSEVSREKAVIQQEIKMGENSLDGALWKLFMKTAYQTHPVRNPVIGNEEVFVKLNRDDLVKYYSERYQPENMVVVVAGNVTPSEVVQFIGEKTRTFLRKTNAPLVLPAEPTQMSSRWAEETIPIARLTQAMIGFPSVSLHHEDLYALDVLGLLMGEGETCRLYCRLKDQENQVLSVSASNWTPSFTRGQLIISLVADPKQWPGVMKTIGEEIDRFKTEPVSAEELQKAKKSAIAEHVFSKETVSALASSLGASFMDTGDAYFDDTYVEKIRSVTAEQVQSAARRYLDTTRMSVAVGEPAKRPQTAAATDANEKSPAQDLTVQYHQLPNGLKVLLKRDPSLPRVTVQLYGLGGLVLEDAQKPGLSSFTASLLTAGTKTRSKIQIHQALEDVGGGISSDSENNTYHVSAKVLKEDLDLALDVVSDVVRNAQFPNEEIEKKREETLLALQRIDENWQVEILRLFKKNYFHHSPYANDRLGTPASVQAFTRDDLLAFSHRMVIPQGSVLAVYGDIDPTRVLAEIEKDFGGWSGGPETPPKLPEEVREIKEDRIVEKKNEKNCPALFIGTNGISIENAQRPALDVLDAILSGANYPGGRLFDALRGGNEDLVYVVSAFPFYGRNAGFFGVITQTTMGNLEKVQTIILNHLKRVRDQAVTDEELRTAKNMIATMHRLDSESLDAQAREAAVNEVLGLGWDYDAKYLKDIQAVTADQVSRVAREICTNTLIARTIPEHPVEILPHPAPKQDSQGPR